MASDPGLGDFGSLLRQLRIDAGLTQEQLAELAGLDRRSIQVLENGNSLPQRGTIRRLAKALTLSPPEEARFEAVARTTHRSRTVADVVRQINQDPRPRLAVGHIHNLTTPLTSFVGRQEERARIKNVLSSARLVSLTGAGGCGKTRLAMQIASEVLAGYPDGVWLVELASLTSPSLVPQTIANALGLHERPEHPASYVLTSYLQTRRCLLLLDNCEHLIDACAKLASTLLQACPHLKILTTSRQPLQIPGEVQWHVASLPTPDPATLLPTHIDLARIQSKYPALRLFAERASAAEPAFSLTPRNLGSVAQVCWHLDGLPLAIELAAARVRTLGIESIASRLAQRFQFLTAGSRVALPRQQTLRATVDWSYDLLSEPERVIFRRLAVFAGSFTMDAVVGVCASEEIAEGQVISILLRLVDQSLVEVDARSGAVRYHLLETMRGYAQDLLVAADDAEAIRRRYHCWYVGWAKKSEPMIWSADQKVWPEHFELEHDNLRAALQFCREDDVVSGLYLASHLHRFWLEKGHIDEGQRWLEDLLKRDVKDALAQGAALFSLGRLYMALAKVREAIPLLEEGLAIIRTSGQSRDLAHALYWLGEAMLSVGDDTRAQRLFEEGIEVTRTTGNLGLQGVLVGGLGRLAFAHGGKRHARDRYLEGLSLTREGGEPRGVGFMLRCLGILALSDGDAGLAQKLLQQSAALAWEIGHSDGLVGAITHLAILAQKQGDHCRAIRLFAAIARDWLPVVTGMEGSERDISLANTRAALGDDSFALSWSEGQAMTLDQAVAYALAEESGRCPSPVCPDSFSQ